MGTINIMTELYSTICPTCGILFAMPNRIDDERRKDHQRFYCPAGHAISYSQQTEVEKLRAQLTEAMARETHLSGEVRHLKKRIRQGVCPCCQRHFVNLNRHMKTKHPEF